MIPSDVWTCCVEESRTSVKFEQTVNITAHGFILGFKDYKLCLLQMMPYLELQFLQPENSDEEVRDFSSDEDWTFSYSSCFAFPFSSLFFFLIRWHVKRHLFLVNIEMNEKRFSSIALLFFLFMLAYFHLAHRGRLRSKVLRIPSIWLNSNLRNLDEPIPI